MAERWRYTDEEMPPLGDTVLIVAENKFGLFGAELVSYLDEYEQRTGWGRTIECWNKAGSLGHTVLAWLPIPQFKRKEKDIG